jgi:hypothetical protein
MLHCSQAQLDVLRDRHELVSYYVNSSAAIFAATVGADLHAERALHR